MLLVSVSNHLCIVCREIFIMLIKAVVIVVMKANCKRKKDAVTFN